MIVIEIPPGESCPECGDPKTIITSYTEEVTTIESAIGRIVHCNVCGCQMRVVEDGITRVEQPSKPTLSIK